MVLLGDHLRELPPEWGFRAGHNESAVERIRQPVDRGIGATRPVGLRQHEQLRLRTEPEQARDVLMRVGGDAADKGRTGLEARTRKGRELPRHLDQPISQRNVHGRFPLQVRRADDLDHSFGAALKATIRRQDRAAEGPR